MNLILEALTNEGAPHVGITATGLPANCVVNVERETLNGFVPVRGGQKLAVMGGSFFLTDHVPPLNTPTTYKVSIVGGGAEARSITVESEFGWISDPLHPGNAIPIAVNWAEGAVVLTARPSGTYSAPADLVTPLGGRFPVGSIGTRGAARQVPIAFTSTPETTAKLRDLLNNAGQIVLRGHNHGALDEVADLVIPDVTITATGKYAHTLSGEAIQVRAISPTITVIWLSFDDLRAFLLQYLGTGATFNDLAAATVPGSSFLDIARDKYLLIGG